MRSNLSEVNIQPWTFYDYRLIDFLQNKTVFCPIKSQWIHFEEYLFTAIGLFITSLVTVRVHATEMRFHDYYALSRCHTMNACLTGLFLISFLFNTHSTETACRWEQVLIQYFSTILIANVFLMAFVRLRHSYFDKQRNDNKLRWTFSIYLISLLVQTLLTVVWLILSRMKPPVSYHRQTCFHRIQIDLCLHAQLPLLFSTVSLPIVFLLTAVNLYRSTRPFAIAQLLESIMCAIGLIMGGSMWYMNLFFSNYPQMPYKYVAYVFLLTYMLPRIWISELERSRITVEEVKPLLHDEVRFQNDNCTILFPNDVDDDDEDTDISFVVSSQQNSQSPTHPTAGDAHQSKPIIRTKEMSPGEIFTSIMDKFDAQSTRCL